VFIVIKNLQKHLPKNWVVSLQLKKNVNMKVRCVLFILTILLLVNSNTIAQCSICTKTAQQLGEGPASALNAAIVYLMMTPLLIMVYLGFRWWKREQQVLASEQNSNK
jgi:hypothetical protein